MCTAACCKGTQAIDEPGSGLHAWQWPALALVVLLQCSGRQHIAMGMLLMDECCKVLYYALWDRCFRLVVPYPPARQGRAY
jgi:hypothetical protein